MKKYKLIKEYPGSIKLGTIVSYYNNWGVYGVDQVCNTSLTTDVVENNPEYWEKVEELEVPIGTKFIHHANKDLIYTLKELSKDNIVTISWIEINKEITNKDYSISEINKYFKDNIWIKYEEPKPVFTTEDGVDIFEGEEYLYVDSNWEIWTFSNSYSVKRYLYFKTFSTEKAAKNYIKLHKPILSYNEVIELYDLNPYPREVFKNKLTELVKLKL